MHDLCVLYTVVSFFGMSHDNSGTESTYMTQLIECKPPTKTSGRVARL